MKYPQLVSTRAVNAISDWLVTRLEQLGVEAPQIYARFLLSLLQSSVQINDPIEYSNLETFIASRKGNNRRLHQLLGDTETLKKLTAVQCLQGIVSPDQEISTIEGLVEELCAKLKEFEQQNTGTSEDATLLLTSEQETQQAEELFKEQSGKKEPGSNLNTRVIAKHRIRAGKLDTIEGAEQAQGLNTVEKKVGGSVASVGGLEKADTETDPKKRYFSAFPALSKGMDEESFRALRKNAKSLTWPVERKQSEQSVAQIAQNSSDSSNSSIYQTAGEQKSKTEDKSCGSEAGAAAKSTTKVRRRSRRRRNQALKTKSMEQKPNSKSKTTTKGAYFVDSEETSVAASAAVSKAEPVANNAHKGKRKERYSTPANWDTDFEGCWEMGRDLIQEFIKNQNNRNERNRSTSESAAYVKKGVSGGCMQNIKQEVKQKPEMTPLAIDLEYYYGNAAKADQAKVASAAEEEDYTLAELTLNVGGTEQRRLYERDTVIDKKSAEQETEHDFEQFKAKFNSSVEALWKDAEPVQPIAEKSEVSHAKLKSFWSHYFQEQTLVAETDVKTIKETAIGSMSLTTQAAELVANTSDYYSMPSTWDEVDKAVPRKTVLPVSNSLYSGSYGRNIESTTPVGVFLNTNSIWSEQPKTTSGANNEENFFYKVWNANQTLTQLDNNADNKSREKPAAHLSKTYLKTGDGYPPFSVSKWSEGINAGPTVSNSNSYQLQGNNFGFVEAPDSSTTDSASASTTSCSSSMYPWPQHPWQTAGVVTQHAPNTVMSLTDMYARDAVDNSNTASTATSSLNSPAVDAVVASTPKVTLANHAFNGKSAFAEYSRIKAVVKKNQSYAPAVMRKTFHNNMDLMCNSNENLLTSELTHFQPIRTYRDGHVFNICSAWDTVHYERSADGFLCLGADKYLEYTRNDNYAAEDDAALAVRSGSASSAPLYASSNCDAATSMRQRKNVEVDKKPFVLKFRVIDNCEVGCQTEDPAVIAAAAAADASTKARLNVLKMTDQHPLAALFAGGARTGMNARAMPKTGIACSDALESLNKAIATAAKTRTQRRTPQTATINATYANNNNNNNNNKYNNNNNNNNFIYQNFNSVYNNNNNNNNQIKRNDLLLMTVDQIEVDWLPATKVAQHVAAGVKNEMYKAKSAADLWPVYHVQRASDTNVEKDQIAAVEYTAVEKNMNMNVVVQNKQVDVEDVDVAAAYCDEVDYCLSGKKSPWTMRAIGKKCQQNEQSKRKRLKNNNNINNNNNNTNNNNNNNKNNNNNTNNNNIISNNVSVDDEDDDNDADDEHTLWGMCAACHTENKALSLPANRLLRDELNQEADEIMNELKNMQDLYIGRDATDDDGNEYADDKEIANEFDVKTEEQQIISNWCNYSPLIVQQQQSKIKDKNKVDMGNTNKVLLQMNQFIEDWLRPATLQGEKYDIWYTNKAKNMDDNATNENVKNVWQKDIQNIWHIKDDAQPQMEIGIQMDTKDVRPHQEENIVKEKRGIAVADTWKPLDLLLQLNAADASPEQSRDRDDAFLSKLSWEHENLAAIWNNSTPLPTVKNVDENENNIINDLEIQSKQELNEEEITSNYDNESQPSDRVKAFLKHLGVLNKKNEKSAVTVTAHNTPKLTIVTAMATATGNRKRRHSESLNLLELMVDGALNPKDKMDLEKLKDILGIDGICCKKTTKIVDTNLANDYGNDKNINENGNDGNDVDNLVVAGEYGFDVHKQQQKQQQQQTIITCKYWATVAAAAATGNNNDNNKKNNMKQYENIDSIIDIDINDELIRSFTMDHKNLDGKAGAQFSCQFDKNNASILRHVTTAMITRPLTR